MELTLSRSSIRSWRPADAPRLAAIANDRSIWIMVRDRFPYPYTVADAEVFIARVGTELPECNFAIAVDDVAVGGIGYIVGDDIHRISAEVGYWLAAEARGNGLATEALSGLVGWLWSNTDLRRVHASVFTRNPASARVLERAGFRQAYLARQTAIKDGVVHDEWIYDKVRDEASL